MPNVLLPAEGATPLCPKCLAEVDVLQHYCSCGWAVGQFTPSIPFVNIPFLVEFFGGMWHRVWARGTSGIERLLCLSVLGLLAIAYEAAIVVLFLSTPLWMGRRDDDAVA